MRQTNRERELPVTTAGSTTRARVIPIALVVLTAVAVAVVLTRSSADYRLHIRIANAGQLVKGNQVKVGGVPVGTVKAIELTPDNEADVEVAITDDHLTPLHRGTRAWIRVSSLSSVANRFIALEPGPN